MDTPKMIRHAIFKTRWGYFGLAGTDRTLCRTCLPVSEPSIAKAVVLSGLFCDSTLPDKGLLPDLQEQIAAYFEGQNVDFSTKIEVDLADRRPFERTVLNTCRRIGFGRTMTYAQLAAAVGSPRAARAVGNAMASNPVPLIIPCHRVLRSDGGLGGFSAIGSTDLKQRLLNLEQLHTCVSAVCEVY
jgi:methylated-DNA-[protein]-cysteine S-methyltransferase